MYRFLNHTDIEKKNYIRERDCAFYYAYIRRTRVRYYWCAGVV